MNKTFAEYSTSTAFFIQLSKNQCNALLVIDERPDDQKGLGDLYLHTVGTMKTLMARGLVYWKTDDRGEPCGFGGLTEAGRLMVGLLKEAGLTVENTRTVSILKRMAA